MNDVHVLDLAKYISFLEPEPPITKELDKWGSRYRSQKIHMYLWIRSQPTTGAGAYSREKGNYSAKVMYNRFLNPGGLLWLAEVLGEEESSLRAAAAAAEEAEKQDYRKRCIAFRSVIPWERTMELYRDWSGWLYDPRMKPLIAVDPKTNYPAIKEGRSFRARYIRIMDEEENGPNHEQQTMIPEAKRKMVTIEASEPPKKEKLTKAERKARGWEF